MSGTDSSHLMLSDRQRLQWLRLIRTENVGPASFRSLINRFGSAAAAIDALPSLTHAGGAKKPNRVPSASEAEYELEAIERAGAKLVAIGEVGYPEIFKHMHMPPPLLTVKGRLELLNQQAISIVGSRSASTAGARMANLLATELGQANYIIVSGLARGIDAAAHRASLKTGTIGVLAGGLNRPYPTENIPLFREIGEYGALVSEMPFDWEPRARDFPRRNRLVAGLGLGLVVVEAAKQSGSLISARLAGELGRLVFAVPGSPFEPRSAGANHLLKEGAILVTEASDILDAMSPLTRSGTQLSMSFSEDIEHATPIPSGTERDLVLGALSITPTPIDNLVRHTGLHPAQFSMILLELDLAGRIERHSNGSISLVTSI